MQFMIPILAFSGIFVGLLLKKYIPEENKPGKKYHLLAERLIFLILGSYLLATAFTSSLYNYIALFIGIILGMFLSQPYLYLGLSLLTIDFVSASLTFIFGVSNGNKNFLYPALFFFAPFLLLLTPIDTTLLLMVASGALFATIMRTSL